MRCSSGRCCVKSRQPHRKCLRVTVYFNAAPLRVVARLIAAITRFTSASSTFWKSMGFFSRQARMTASMSLGSAGNALRLFMALVGCSVGRPGLDQVQQVASGGQCFPVADKPSAIDALRIMLQLVDLAVDLVQPDTVPARVPGEGHALQSRHVAFGWRGDDLQDPLGDARGAEQSIVEIKPGDP